MNSITDASLLIASIITTPFALTIAGYIRVRYGVKTNYTRKLMHFLVIFSTAIIITIGGNEYIPVLVAVGTTSIILSCIYTNSLWYKGIARETDAPYERRYILLPLIATLLAATVNRVLFDPISWLVGSLVLAIGDAVAEPVGVKFGKHKYTVRGFDARYYTKSYEGSLAVFVSSAIVSYIVLHDYYISFIVGVVATIVEATSPHGFDNYTIHLSTCSACYLLLNMPPF